MGFIVSPSINIQYEETISAYKCGVCRHVERYIYTDSYVELKCTECEASELISIVEEELDEESNKYTTVT